MLGRVEAISVFTNLFLQKKDIVKGLSYLFTLCKSNRTLPKTKSYLDKMFIVKFLFSIDKRINKRLSECGKQNTVEDTSIELVDFSTIMADLKLNR